MRRLGGFYLYFIKSYQQLRTIRNLNIKLEKNISYEQKQSLPLFYFSLSFNECGTPIKYSWNDVWKKAFLREEWE